MRSTYGFGLPSAIVGSIGPQHASPGDATRTDIWGAVANWHADVKGSEPSLGNQMAYKTVNTSAWRRPEAHSANRTGSPCVPSASVSTIPRDWVQ